MGGWGLEVYYECFGEDVYRPTGDNVPLKRDFDDSATIWDLMHWLDELHDYIKCVEALHACLKEQEIHLEGFLGLKEYVEQIYRDNGFGELKKDILNLRASTSDLKP